KRRLCIAIELLDARQLQVRLRPARRPLRRQEELLDRLRLLPVRGEHRAEGYPDGGRVRAELRRSGQLLERSGRQATPEQGPSKGEGRPRRIAVRLDRGSRRGQLRGRITGPARDFRLHEERLRVLGVRLRRSRGEELRDPDVALGEV